MLLIEVFKKFEIVEFSDFSEVSAVVRCHTLLYGIFHFDLGHEAKRLQRVRSVTSNHLSQLLLLGFSCSGHHPESLTDQSAQISRTLNADYCLIRNREKMKSCYLSSAGSLMLHVWELKRES